MRSALLGLLFFTRWAIAGCELEWTPIEDRIRAAYSAADLVVLAEHSDWGGLIAVAVWKGDTTSTLAVWQRRVVYPAGKRFAVFAARTASGLEDETECLDLPRERVIAVLERLYGPPRPVPPYWGAAEGLLYAALFLSLIGVSAVLRQLLDGWNGSALRPRH